MNGQSHVIIGVELSCIRSQGGGPSRPTSIFKKCLCLAKVGLINHTEAAGIELCASTLHYFVFCTTL